MPSLIARIYRFFSLLFDSLFCCAKIALQMTRITIRHLISNWCNIRIFVEFVPFVGEKHHCAAINIFAIRVRHKHHMNAKHKFRAFRERKNTTIDRLLSTIEYWISTIEWEKNWNLRKIYIKSRYFSFFVKNIRFY